MSNTEVTKTLVIGLGSTGTRVANNLIRRLTWKYGSADRAPWVQFMAIETNTNEPAPILSPRGDFFPIALDGRTYGQILSSPESYRTIQLEQWADMQTLRLQKDTEGGAGNIRMLGRLTFMVDPNYTTIRRALLDRVARLRDLQSSTAQEKRGALPDGSDPTITFAGAGEMRIFIVGTLCGGTGSGLLPDFGYFVKTVVRDSEKIIGIFSLPHPGLTPAVATNASRMKKNAYHALMELNHYHQSAYDSMLPIVYPDGTNSNMKVEPYDLPYLVMPNTPTKSGEIELNELIADRIYMNIVSPEADPFSQSIDAPRPDRDHQAHVFSTFGLSVAEFPADQITEAAAKKLLHGALSEWQRGNPETVSDLTAEIGLDWVSLMPFALDKPVDEWLRDATRAVNSELDTEKLDFTRLDRALSELRRAVAPDGGLSGQMRARRDLITEAIYQRFTEHAHESLLDRIRGPQILATEVGGLIEYLRGLQEAAKANTAVSQSEAGEAWQKVDAAVTRLKDEVKKVSFFNKNKGNIQGAQRDLRDAARNFAKIQMESAVYASMQTYSKHGTVDFGVCEHLERLLLQVQANLTSLNHRVTALRNRLARDTESLSDTVPSVNGLVLFEQRTTVNSEYRHALESGKQSSIEHLDNIEARHYERLIRSWTDLPEVIVPSSRQLEKTWINAAFDPKGDFLIPQTMLTRLLREAALPFSLALAQENVIERLMRERELTPAIDNRIRNAAERATPFLHLNKPKAMEGNRSPVLEKQSVFIPMNTAESDMSVFKSLISSSFSASNVLFPPGSDRTRSLFLEEAYRFPLRGLDQVLGDGGLHSAECNDFPTFHTRRDVLWYGLSRREAQLLDDATEALVVGLILGELTVRDGLVLSWTSTGFGDRDFRRLPIHLPAAARALAQGERDQDGFSLTGALPTLQARIEQHWKRHDLDVQEGALAFVRHLDEQLTEFYRHGRQVQVKGWGDQSWAGEQLSKFTARHSPLHHASMTLFPPPPATINALTLRKDQPGRWGGFAPKDGLFCPACGGEIGETVQEAAQNGWRCFNDSTHYYGPGAAVLVG
ncbi:tubulin-like doman-containing protein [Deinococcus daejeonensis]|uniref:Tubulin like n=1 Tax=Deinococcus daejeonensis TaxID=1007098 RepID=A0ABQ2JL01_9DEIO|nr:tubulin-like doman-containing protein [Deinococcus daejeonensis]GGN47269.1 hypothetical protein GCM10010842_38620 [Deinococcus daejeonensis]